MLRFIPILVLVSLLFSCEESVQSSEKDVTLVVLPSDLNNIPDSSFHHLDSWLKGAEIIGISEAEHGMMEAMDFRNAYIKHLVETNKVQVLAFESGLIESRIVNDYIHGADLDLDTVLYHGISYTFGQFKQTKELLQWLRKTNTSRKPEDRINFYGFDMAGNAPNPYWEDASFALKEYFKYLETVDSELHRSFISVLEAALPYLHIKDNENDPRPSFSDWSAKDMDDYNYSIDLLQLNMQSKRAEFIDKTDTESYEWAHQSIVCARQNLKFLKGYHEEKINQSCREQFMLDNLKWIQKREPNKRIVLFAHLSHLAKETSRVDQNGSETLSKPMFGALLADNFGEKYKVIGNFYSIHDYHDETYSVPENSFPTILHNKYNFENFCLLIDPSDTLFNVERTTREDHIGTHHMNVSKGVDIILYTHRQEFFQYPE